jgi:hypothetical protein
MYTPMDAICYSVIDSIVQSSPLTEVVLPIVMDLIVSQPEYVQYILLKTCSVPKANKTHLYYIAKQVFDKVSVVEVLSNDALTASIINFISLKVLSTNDNISLPAMMINKICKHFATKDKQYSLLAESTSKLAEHLQILHNFMGLVHVLLHNANPN